MQKIILKKSEIIKIHKALSYDAISGVFKWRIKRTNNVNIGAIAGTRTIKGYCQITILSRRYYAHRLAWLYVKGHFPSNQIDHIDGDKFNNKFSNLQEVTNRGNQENLKRAKSNNISGLLGVRKVTNSNKFCAQIIVKGKPLHLGVFDRAKDAHEAYIKNKRKLHKNCHI